MKTYTFSLDKLFPDVKFSDKYNDISFQWFGLEYSQAVFLYLIDYCKLKGIKCDSKFLINIGESFIKENLEKFTNFGCNIPPVDHTTLELKIQQSILNV